MTSQGPDIARDDQRTAAQLAATLTAWLKRDQRDLPWRNGVPPGQREPWPVLVSELMLQQTQVARVADRFPAFIAAFPTPAAMAAAGEDAVLAAWSGLGYYRRARHLFAAAKAITVQHDGDIPQDIRSLRALPGVGDYTAGALASLAFGAREPAIDGNVIRVALRIRGVAAAPESREAKATVAAFARALVEHAEQPGAVNEALMELGATVCTPASPRCETCPVQPHCVAHADGTQSTIPPPKRRAAVKTLHAAAVVARDTRGRYLLEQRPAKGLWAGLWQPPTIENAERPPTEPQLIAATGAKKLIRVRTFTHQTTHRTVLFEVYEAAGLRAVRGRRWCSEADIAAIAMGTAQRRALGLDPRETDTITP